MGTVDELYPDKSGLCAKKIGIDLMQLVPAKVIIAVAGGAGKIAIRHPVVLKGSQHPLGIFLGYGIDAGKFINQLPLGLITQGTHFIA